MLNPGHCSREKHLRGENKGIPRPCVYKPTLLAERAISMVEAIECVRIAKSRKACQNGSHVPLVARSIILIAACIEFLREQGVLACPTNGLP